MRRVRPQGASGRASLPGAAYLRLKWMILDRAEWRCERCRGQAYLDIDHAIPRSAGGADSWSNLTALCSGPLGCHARKDWPYDRGRLIVEPQGDGRFRYVIAFGTKAAPLEFDVRWGGRAPTEEEAVLLAEIMAEARTRKLTGRR